SIARGADHVPPRSVDSVKYTCGASTVPLTYVITIRSVASVPVGAPLAISTLGAMARSLRAPATPSITGRPCTGSSTPGWVTGPATGRNADHVRPPFPERDIISNTCLPFEDEVPSPNTYAFPLLSVR